MAWATDDNLIIDLGLQTLNSLTMLPDSTSQSNGEALSRLTRSRFLLEQIIPFDKNDGSGFWWANSLNSFTRNVAAECDEYGYFFQAAKTCEPLGPSGWSGLRPWPTTGIRNGVRAACK